MAREQTRGPRERGVSTRGIPSSAIVADRWPLGVAPSSSTPTRRELPFSRHFSSIPGCPARLLRVRALSIRTLPTPRGCRTAGAAALLRVGRTTCCGASVERPPAILKAPTRPSENAQHEPHALLVRHHLRGAPVDARRRRRAQRSCARRGCTERSSPPGSRKVGVAAQFIVHDGRAGLDQLETRAPTEYSAPAYCLWYLARKASKDGCCAEKPSVASEKERSSRRRRRGAADEELRSRERGGGEATAGGAGRWPVIGSDIVSELLAIALQDMCRALRLATVAPCASKRVERCAQRQRNGAPQIREPRSETGRTEMADSPGGHMSSEANKLGDTYIGTPGLGQRRGPAGDGRHRRVRAPAAVNNWRARRSGGDGRWKRGRWGEREVSGREEVEEREERERRRREEEETGSGERR